MKMLKSEGNVMGNANEKGPGEVFFEIRWITKELPQCTTRDIFQNNSWRV